LIPNPIRRVLSSIERKRVRALLMGGQACVLYGAAEFSRDTDLAVLASPANLQRLQAALDDLDAHVVGVPPFEARYLRCGHAVHFRCQDPEAEGMRIDVMARMRGVAVFSTLWARRTSIELPDGGRSLLGPAQDRARAASPESHRRLT
jgi:PHD/YefM family antitoxin component YafN of YafNO toxin-antitoxin module